MISASRENFEKKVIMCYVAETDLLKKLSYKNSMTSYKPELSDRTFSS